MRLYLQKETNNKEVTMLPSVVAGERFRNSCNWRHDAEMMSPSP